MQKQREKNPFFSEVRYTITLIMHISFEVKDSMAKYTILLHVASTNTANYKNYYNITKTKLAFI